MNDKILKSLEMLDKNDIMYEVKNDGIHLIVEGNDGFIDYYPTTGNWKVRDNLDDSDFGIRKLNEN